MTETNERQHKLSTAALRPAAVPPVGAHRPGSFWQRWKEWERTNGTIPASATEPAA